ncbi:MAG TPA: hypothetical protein ENJ95_05715 [Bacteroidetes bacterium]|nr:hypothetical protein [Bacteroidota bacterium]
MKKILIVSLLTVAVFQLMKAQAHPVSPSSKIGILVNGGIVNTYMFNPPFFWVRCIEGCTPEYQQWKKGIVFNLGLSYQLNERHYLYLSGGYSSFGFKEKVIQFEFPNGREDKKSWKFIGLELGHQFNILITDEMKFFLANGIRPEMTVQDEYDVLKKINLSYSGRLGIEYAVNDHFGITFNGLFKSALLKYNKSDRVGFYNDYLPYGLGLELGAVIHR